MNDFILFIVQNSGVHVPLPVPLGLRGPRLYINQPDFIYVAALRLDKMTIIIQVSLYIQQNVSTLYKLQIDYR